jgi:hypothetical protein
MSGQQSRRNGNQYRLDHNVAIPSVEVDTGPSTGSSTPASSLTPTASTASGGVGSPILSRSQPADRSESTNQRLDRLVLSETPPQSRRRASSRIIELPHAVEDEELPSDAFNNGAFQEALSTSKDVITEISNLISGSSISREPGSTIQRLQQKATELANFSCSKSRRVGFVGDSGVG